jgi:hypothetical protein
MERSSKEIEAEKDWNKTLFMFDNNLSDMEFEFIKAKWVRDGRRPDIVRLPSNEIKELKWGELL